MDTASALLCTFRVLLMSEGFQVHWLMTGYGWAPSCADLPNLTCTTVSRMSYPQRKVLFSLQWRPTSHYSKLIVSWGKTSFCLFDYYALEVWSCQAMLMPIHFFLWICHHLGSWICCPPCLLSNSDDSWENHFRWVISSFHSSQNCWFFHIRYFYLALDSGCLVCPNRAFCETMGAG